MRKKRRPCTCEAYPFPHRRNSNPRISCDELDQPERGWRERHFNPFTGRYFYVDTHPSLTAWERNV